jgi:hypothetical protein
MGLANSRGAHRHPARFPVIEHCPPRHVVHRPGFPTCHDHRKHAYDRRGGADEPGTVDRRRRRRDRPASRAGRGHLSAILTQVRGAVASGDKVQLPGFGTFERRERGARTARHPSTGAPLQHRPHAAPCTTSCSREAASATTAELVSRPVIVRRLSWTAALDRDQWPAIRGRRDPGVALPTTQRLGPPRRSR